VAQEIHEEYISAKESSEYRVEMQRIEQEESRRWVLDARRETMAALTNAKADGRAQEAWDAQEQRELEEQTAMEHQMLLAQQDRDSALQNLEYLRGHVREPALVQPEA